MGAMAGRRLGVGAERLASGDVHLRVWAPKAGRVTAVLERGPGAPADVPLVAGERGYHAGLLPGAGPGTRYRLRLDDAPALLPDPASRSQPEGAHGPSEVVDPAAFPWTDALWSGTPPRRWILYELHVGAFTPEGTFDAAIGRLGYLADLGVDAIELMPVAQFPGERNWGYDGVFPYAPQHSYGGPDGLRRLVDACHGAGIAVLLDVVYNHLGPEGNVLPAFGPYFTDRYRTPWGDALNFDGPDSDEVRRYFVDNALMWLEDYHLDGLRLDAVHTILDPLAQPFLAELAEAVHRRAADLGRRFALTAESDLNDARLVLPPVIHGFGLDAQWADDFHHAVEAQLLGAESAYAADFGAFADLGRAMRRAFVYTGQYSPMRRRRFGRPPEPATAERFVVFVQNHDQAGNRPGGDRLGHLLSFAQRKLAAGAVLLAPFVPLLFMGEEYDEPSPFLYFTSHADPALIEAVRAGRREEFAKWGWAAAAPDPQAKETFERSKIRPELRHEGKHAALFAWYRALIRLRRSVPALATPSTERLGVVVREAEQVLAVRRWDEGSETLAILAFAAEPVAVTLPVPAGDWRLLLDAADPHFLGPGPAAPTTLPSDGLVRFDLPPHASLLFERTTGEVAELDG